MIRAIAIGTSAGGLEALEYLLPHLPAESKIAVFIVQHITADSDSYFIKMLKNLSHLKVKEPCSTEEIKKGTIYIAPPDYHLMIESDYTLSLNFDEKVNHSRPSIDVLFETAAEVYRHELLGVLLTGSNADGSKGLLKIHEAGGKTIVENPATAYMSTMPQSALNLFTPDYVMTLEEIARVLVGIESYF